MSKVYRREVGYRQWAMSHPGSGTHAIAESRDEVTEVFRRTSWAQLNVGEYEVIDGPPPFYREGFAAKFTGQTEAEKPPPAQAPKVEDLGARVFNELVKRVHSDVNPNTTYNADQVVAMLLELRSAYRGDA